MAPHHTRYANPRDIHALPTMRLVIIFSLLHLALPFNLAPLAPSSSTSLYKERPVSKGFGSPKVPSFTYGSVKPMPISPPRTVPQDEVISFPDYAATGTPKGKSPILPWVIEKKSSLEITKMRAAGRAAREVLDLAGALVRPGITTDEIDAAVHAASLARNAYPSPLNYHGFPKSCCTSVNEVICHGIPDARALVEGDVVNIDITVYLDGYHGDCSEMFEVGVVDEKAKEVSGDL